MTFARGTWRDAASARACIVEGKREKHARTCRSHGFDFISFGFTSLGSFDPAPMELLSCICQRYSSHAQVSSWEAHSLVFCRSSFAVMRGVVEQFVGRHVSTRMVICHCCFVTIVIMMVIYCCSCSCYVIQRNVEFGTLCFPKERLT